MSDSANRAVPRGRSGEDRDRREGPRRWATPGAVPVDGPDAFGRLRDEFEHGETLRPLTIVIPMFQEEARIARTVEILAKSELPRHDIGFCFVDDGSTDKTVSVTEAAVIDNGLNNAEIYQLDRNHGKGGAVRAGVLYAARHSHLVGYLDADLSLSPSEVLTALARLELTRADALVGERVVNAEKQPKLRRIASLVFRKIATSLVPTGVNDSQCAMKIFRSSVAEDVFGALQTTGFAFDVEVLARLKLGDFVVAESAVLWEHQPGSKVNATSDSVKMLREVLAIRKMLRSDPRSK